ncbi:MAG: NUDIX domain-containing protein [Arcobacteraceae bacterium]
MSKSKAYGICIYKIKNKTIKILLCKSINSQEKWGFLKGITLKYEQHKRCAQREFFEESSIFVRMENYEEYFEQINPTKDVGIWLVNYEKVEHIDDYFLDDVLGSNYLSKENSEVKFFDIENLPKIRTKQLKIAKDLKSFLKKKY